MAKHKYISSPRKMLQLFNEYVEHAKSNPIKVQDYVGKEAFMVYREKEVPLTMEGFENFVASKPRMPWDLKDYFANTNGAYSEFSPICSRIKKMIREDQIKGGMAGIYNPSITQRLNGLVDKTESKMNVDVKQITGLEVK